MVRCDSATTGYGGRGLEDGAQAPGQWASGLVSAGDADAYKVRGMPGEAVGARAVALNTTDGPLAIHRNEGT